MDAIDTIRAFNRATLRRVGEVETAYKEHGVSLPEARVLAELHRLGRTSTRPVANALGLDEGYLSRLIGTLGRDGLLTRTVNTSDRRTRILRLTAAGQKKVDELTALSRNRVAAWFEGAGPGAAEDVARHLRAVEARITGADLAPVALSPLLPGDLGWVIQEHGQFYAKSEGFDARFEALVARILAEFQTNLDPKRERGWIARRADRRLGSIFCAQGPEPDLAKLRLFYLVPEARGQGLGQAMITECLSFARAAGYQRMTLWTHKSQAAACAIYRKMGFTCIASDPKVSFGAEVIEEVYEREL